MMKTAGELAVAIGTEGTIEVNGMHVAVEVIDMRQRWGMVDALIRPLVGSGQTWIEARRVCVRH